MPTHRRRPRGTGGSLLLIWLTATVAAGTCLGPERRVSASDPDHGDRFGHAVDIFGSLAVLGAPGDDEEGTNAGAAYVFASSSSNATALDDQLGNNATAGGDELSIGPWICADS